MKQWKWTRQRYEKARRLARIMGALSHLPPQAPSLVERYWDLMQPIDQQHDPMDQTIDGWYWRDLKSRLAAFKRKKRCKDDDDEIPF